MIQIYPGSPSTNSSHYSHFLPPLYYCQDLMLHLPIFPAHFSRDLALLIGYFDPSIGSLIEYLQFLFSGISLTDHQW